MNVKTDAEILKAIFRYGSRTKTIHVPMDAVPMIYEELFPNVEGGALYEEYFVVATNNGDIRVQGV